MSPRTTVIVSRCGLLLAPVALGLLVATLRSSSAPVQDAHAASGVDQRDAVPVRTYTELGESPWRARSVADLDAFAAVEAPPADAPRQRDPSRRAYAGAPPVIPHAIQQRHAPACLACHERGVTLPSGLVAARMTHEPMASCVQCHAVSVSPMPHAEPPDASRFDPNGFEGVTDLPNRLPPPEGLPVR